MSGDKYFPEGITKATIGEIMNFKSDNTAGVSQQVLAAIQNANSDYASSYGEDELSLR